MKKRFLSMFLALALCMGLAVLPTPAYAAELTFDDGWLTFSDYVVTDRYENLGGQDPDDPPFYGDNNAYCYFLGTILIPGDGLSYCSFLLPSDATITFNCSEYSISAAQVKRVDTSGPMLWTETDHLYKSFTAAEDGTVWDMARLQAEFPGCNSWSCCLESFQGSKRPTPVQFRFDGTDFPPSNFTDVPDWCSNAVDWALVHNVTTGTTATKFSPSTQCSQAMILTFLWRATALIESDTDLPVDITGMNIDYAEWALRWAAEKGMVNQTLDPTGPCTRADAVTYIWKAFGSQSAAASSFNDVPASASYAAAVNWAVANGIVEGYPDGNFHPEVVCNRGVIVTMLHRASIPSARLG